MKVEFCPLNDYESTISMLMDINSRLTKTSCKRVLKKDKIPEKSWEKHKPIEISLSTVNHGTINPAYSGESMEIIEENESFIAVNKPIRVHTHPHDYSCTNNILSYLASINKLDALKVNIENYDRGVLYRLDYETSGIVILSKSDSLYRDVRDQFYNIAKKKIYIAKVMGNAEDILGGHEHPMKVSQKKGSLITLGDENSYIGELKITDIKYCPQSLQSVLKIELITGHRHQIRFQLSQLGFPILGDTIYEGDKSHRMHLHALEYGLETSTTKVSLKTGIPAEFEL